MSQVTIYLDEPTLKRVKSAAKREHASVSHWVKQQLTVALEDEWPKDYFSVFGALRDRSFKRPKQPAWRQDHKREEL